MIDNFSKYCVSHGATIYPLVINSEHSEHLGLCNPSVFIDGGKIKLILRNVNYALWASDMDGRFESPFGPLWYITDDNDQHLRTQNFLCEIKDGSISHKLIDTSKNDWEPQWEFVGQEDMRLVRWNGKLYGTGVQRDWNTTGIGRMHLSELSEDGVELSRVRIEAPENKESYCEKNWMPIIDMPYHYVKWCVPTEIVKFDPHTGRSVTVLLKEQSGDIKYINTDNMGIRGSSQVVRVGDYRIAIVHMCKLWMNEKNQKSNIGYYEQFIVWDNDWNIVKLSEPFKFCNFGVEFTNGLAYDNGVFYIPFALQDNFSFMLTVDESVVMNFINGRYSEGEFGVVENNLIQFIYNPTDSDICFNLGDEYYTSGHYASAMVCFERACEYNTFKTTDELYYCMYMLGKSISNMGGRDVAEESIWLKMVDVNPGRSEGYIMLSRFYSWRGLWNKAYTFAKLALGLDNYRFMDNVDARIEYLKTKYYTEDYKNVINELLSLTYTSNMSQSQENTVKTLIDMINNNQVNRYRVL